MEGCCEMKISLVSDQISEIQTDCVLIGLFENDKENNECFKHLDLKFDKTFSELIRDGEITGKSDSLTLVHSLNKITPKRVLVCGLGRKDVITKNKLRDFLSAAFRKARSSSSSSCSVVVGSFTSNSINSKEIISIASESFNSGLYKYEVYKSSKNQSNIDELTLVVEDNDFSKNLDTLQRCVSNGETIGQSVNLARDLSNGPPNHMTPTHLSEVAIDTLAGTVVNVEVMDSGKMETMGMGALLGVARGSAEPPKLIAMDYIGDKDNPGNSIALLGKGITFDSGGLDLKSPAGMRTMKGDMAGGAAVIGAMKSVAFFKPKINVLGIVPATENMPGASAQRPSDVVTAMDGTTIEIDNTDAEGRLVLADAVCYARSKGVNRIVDIATLTGAVRSALGDQCIGAFGNDPLFTEMVIDAGDRVGERIWELPTFEEYKSQFNSDIADLKNSGGSGAGAITGAMFIGSFVEQASWVHLDIAATSMTSRTKGDLVKGATGSGVRTLIELCQILANEN